MRSRAIGHTTDHHADPWSISGRADEFDTRFDERVLDFHECVSATWRYAINILKSGNRPKCYS